MPQFPILLSAYVAYIVKFGLVESSSIKPIVAAITPKNAASIAPLELGWIPANPKLWAPSSRKAKL